MRILIVAVALLAASIQPVHAQEVDAPEGATIASARVSGIETARLSPGLREAIAALAGTPLSRAALREIASRIEAEQPRYIAATRAVQDPDGAVRVVFLVARIPTADRDANVNARYTVEIDLGQFESRFRLPEVGLGAIDLGLIGPGIDRKQDLANLHVGSIDKMNLGNAPGYLRLDRHHFAGHELADRVKINGDILSRRDGDGYRGWRALERRRRLSLTARKGQTRDADQSEPRHGAPSPML